MPEIAEIGYHCRDYFVKQWDAFSHIHLGVLAHSTHLRGADTYDAQTGQEQLRVRVTLATGIPEAACRAANLGYLDPSSVDISAAEADPDILVVPRAGEVLFRLRLPGSKSLTGGSAGHIGQSGRCRGLVAPAVLSNTSPRRKL